jgi:hypothetical protein
MRGGSALGARLPDDRDEAKEDEMNDESARSYGVVQESVGICLMNYL